MTNNANKAKGEYDSWEAAAHEYESENRDKGLWAELYAKNKGDENRTKADYIRQRADALINGSISQRTIFGDSSVSQKDWIADQLIIAKYYFKNRDVARSNQEMADRMLKALADAGCSEADVMLRSLKFVS
jgi:hypothetical protein